MAGSIRSPGFQTVTLTNSLTTTPAINFGGSAGGKIYLKPNSAITGITFYGAGNTAGGSVYTPTTFGPSYDQTGTAVAYSGLAPSTTGLGIPIPDACFGDGAIKMVIAGVASEAVDINLKS
jgi:hypothetical protein